MGFSGQEYCSGLPFPSRIFLFSHFLFLLVILPLFFFFPLCFSHCFLFCFLWPLFLWFMFNSVSACSVAQSCLTLCNTMDCSLPGSFVHGIGFPGKNTGLGSHFLLPPDPRIELVSPVSSALAGGFFTSEPPGNSLFNGSQPNFSYFMFLSPSSDFLPLSYISLLILSLFFLILHPHSIHILIVAE